MALSMKQQVLVIHGGNAFETHEEYISYLQNAEVTLERIQFKDWKKNLSGALGEHFEVIAPQMPNAMNARYAEWKIWFEKLIPLLHDEIIFIGHSLGGIFLAKYLSENVYPKAIKATFLIAAPYNTENEHPLVDFIITKDLSLFEKQGGIISLYHSTDDFIVPYSNFIAYQNVLPNARAYSFDDKNHFLQAAFPELVVEIQKL
jgi:uncharacterized protein